MGLLDYMIRRAGKGALMADGVAQTPQATGKLLSRLNDYAKRHPVDPEEVQAARAGLPGPPAKTQWHSAQAPAPQFKLGGMRPISGGGRRSF